MTPEIGEVFIKSDGHDEIATETGLRTMKEMVGQAGMMDISQVKNIPEYMDTLWRQRKMKGSEKIAPSPVKEAIIDDRTKHQMARN